MSVFGSEKFVKHFWDRVDIGGPDDCWEWKLMKNPRGYGVMGINSVPRFAHRVAYALFNETDLMEPEAICHSCDNPPCCNPAHLWAGTRAENNADMKAKGRVAHGEKVSAQRRSRGMKGDRHPSTKILSPDHDRIVWMREQGFTLRSIADEYGVSRSTIGRIVRSVTR